jgi:hypothetical protein
LRCRWFRSDGACHRPRACVSRAPLRPLPTWLDSGRNRGAANDAAYYAQGDTRSHGSIAVKNRFLRFRKRLSVCAAVSRRPFVSATQSSSPNSQRGDCRSKSPSVSHLREQRCALTGVAPEPNSDEASARSVNAEYGDECARAISLNSTGVVVGGLRSRRSAYSQQHAPTWPTRHNRPTSLERRRIPRPGSSRSLVSHQLSDHLQKQSRRREETAQRATREKLEVLG